MNLGVDFESVILLANKTHTFFFFTHFETIFLKNFFYQEKTDNLFPFSHWKLSDKQFNDYITVYLHQQGDSQRVTSQKMAYLALVCSVSLKNHQKLDKLSIDVADLKKKRDFSTADESI